MISSLLMDLLGLKKLWCVQKVRLGISYIPKSVPYNNRDRREGLIFKLPNVFFCSLRVMLTIKGVSINRVIKTMEQLVV